MYKNAVVAAVVPAFNEERHIEDVIRSMPSFVDHIIVVDDCSTDATAARVRSVLDPRLLLITHEKNQGVGGAILSGHRASSALRSDVNVVMAGDGQMDSAYLSALLDPVVDYGYGFAKANRFFSMTSFAGMPKHRLIGSLALSFATKFASGYWHLFDPQNGYTALHRDALDRLTLERLENGYSFENDLLIQLNILRVPAVDVPIPAVYGSEVSGIRLSRVVPQILQLLFRGFWKRFFYKYVLWSFSPIALFLITGLALVGAGLAVGAWVVAHTLGEPMASTGSVLLAVTPFIVGTNMIMYALLLDIQESPDLPVTHRGLPEHWNRASVGLRRAPVRRSETYPQRPRDIGDQLALHPALGTSNNNRAVLDGTKTESPQVLGTNEPSAVRSGAAHMAACQSAVQRKGDAVQPDEAHQEHDALHKQANQHERQALGPEPSVGYSDGGTRHQGAEHHCLPEGEEVCTCPAATAFAPDDPAVQQEGRKRENRADGEVQQAGVDIPAVARHQKKDVPSGHGE